MKFLRKLLEKRRHQRYVAGYDWAAGGVLRGDITPSDVDAYTVGKGNDPFDRGAIAALFAISRLKRIEVNL